MSAGRRMVYGRRQVCVNDAEDTFFSWLRSIAEDQRRRHPGSRVTVAGVAAEVLRVARQTPEIERRLRR